MSKILLIDDESFARVTLRKILERAGHEIMEAGNGVEGIQRFREGSFDLVITDIVMPEKEGIELIIELKQDFPDVRIIAVSGGGRTRNVDYLKLALQHGARATLEKPFSRAALLDAVNAVLAAPA